VSAGGDALMDALIALFEAPPNPCFEAIRYCPEQHVLSFRRSGGDDWVNVWLHTETDESDFAHVVERNGSAGGSADVLLWEDGVRMNGQFVFNMPLRTDLAKFDDQELYRGRVRHAKFPLVAGDDEPGWYTHNPAGTCYFCKEPTTHVVEWPAQSDNPERSRTFVCAADAEKIRSYQLTIGVEVAVREA